MTFSVSTLNRKTLPKKAFHGSPDLHFHVEKKSDKDKTTRGHKDSTRGIKKREEEPVQRDRLQQVKNTVILPVGPVTSQLPRYNNLTIIIRRCLVGA